MEVSTSFSGYTCFLGELWADDDVGFEPACLDERGARRRELLEEVKAGGKG